MAYVTETSVGIAEDCCNRLNPASRMYLHPPENQHDNASAHKEMKYLPKRQAQTWENDIAKVPKLSMSHLSPRVYHSPVDQYFMPNISNATFSDNTNTVIENGMLHSQTTQMNVAVAQDSMHLQSVHYSDKQMNKLSAQKIAIGI